MNNNQKPSTNPLMLLGLGVVAGWLAKKFLESPKGQEVRENVMASAEELKTRLMDSDEAQRLQEIFDDPSEEAAKVYATAQKQLVTELAALKTTFDQIDKDKYYQIVGDIVTQFKDKQTLPEKQLNKLKSSLEADFKKLQTNRAAQVQPRHSQIAKAK